jgi:AcrR family transcriptional regulator
MKLRRRQMAETRRAILEAVAAQISESGMDEFSIQAVADRAGVTHRTVYNYFPTREALNDAFAEHVEALGAEQGIVRPERDADVASLPELAGQLNTWFGPHASHIQAYVMMTIATGTAPRVFRERSEKMEKLIDDELGPLEPGVAKLVTSAIRMFISSTGWFLLSKHHGLSAAEAGRVSQWAVKALLNAARSGDAPKRLDKRAKRNA